MNITEHLAAKEPEVSLDLDPSGGLRDQIQMKDLVILSLLDLETREHLLKSSTFQHKK